MLTIGNSLSPTWHAARLRVSALSFRLLGPYFALTLDHFTRALYRRRLVCYTFYPGGRVVANIKSAKKRIRQTKVRTLRNKIQKTMFRTAIRRFETALSHGDVVTAEEALRFVYARLDRAAQKGAIHKNMASRKKSRLSHRLNQHRQVG